MLALNVIQANGVTINFELTVSEEFNFDPVCAMVDGNSQGLVPHRIWSLCRWRTVSESSIGGLYLTIVGTFYAKM